MQGNKVYKPNLNPQSLISSSSGLRILILLTTHLEINYLVTSSTFVLGVVLFSCSLSCIFPSTKPESAHQGSSGIVLMYQFLRRFLLVNF